MDFQKTNNIIGWSLFGLATLVYTLTVEETASFWDCGEFIAVSYKLMVSHPPGAPFFMLMGRLFSFFAMGDTEQVAFWINMLSVVSSGLTIMLLFWTIVLLGRKLMEHPRVEEYTSIQRFTLFSSAAVGALIYTFSDTFWFSAVEAEVYAMSSFFTAFVVWAMLKWEITEDESSANRWLILIAYMIGLSIGVHLLNLVTIPALGLIYYFKKYSGRTTIFGGVIALFLSGVIIIIINNLIIPGLPSIAGAFEIMFVNNLGLPFGSGALFFGLLVIGGVVLGIYISHKKQKEIWNTALVSLAFILIGYSSYSIIVIRSNFDPPIDENNPEDVMTFVRFLKREQYGSRPLLYGQYFDAQPVDSKEGAPVYSKGKEKYVETDRKFSYVYPDERQTIFPRIYSTDAGHQQRYRQILNLRQGERPDFGDNIRYLFQHQLGTMYFRYFLWNFSGRESDVKDAGVVHLFNFANDVPTSIEENKGRNNYFMIPLFLGLLGLFYQYFKDKKNFLVVGLLFVLTGIALILYLNGPPTEPRERDYIYVGSYYAFAIWAGFSVIAFADFISGFLKNKKAALGIATAFCMSGPILMAAENWDDHDRSDRFFSVDSAKNFLSSVEENAILMTGGDNDTFPLWYVQEVEGFRTDVRAIVLSYSNTDWYIDQMKQKMYESEPLPISLTETNYQQGGKNDYLFFSESGIDILPVNTFLDLVRTESKYLRGPYKTNIVPSKTFVLQVDSAKVKKMGIIPSGMDSLLVPNMVFQLKGNTLEKKDLLLLDMLATNNWERPIYLNNTSRQQINFNLDPYLVQEGEAYRILPIFNRQNEYLINTEVMYENLMKEFQFRQLDNPDTYHNEDYRDFARNARLNFNTLIEALIKEGKLVKANEAMDYILEKIPDESIRYDVSTFTTVDLMYQLERDEEATEMARVYGRRLQEEIAYLLNSGASSNNYELQRKMAILDMLQQSLLENGQNDLAREFETSNNNSINTLEQLQR